MNKMKLWDSIQIYFLKKILYHGIKKKNKQKLSDNKIKEEEYLKNYIG